MPSSRTRHVAAFLVPVALAIGLPAVAAPPPPAGEALAALFAGLHEEGRFDGTVLVAEGGVIVFEQSYGLADAAAGRPITAATRFDVAAVAKPIVATAALVLVERGVLALDDPVAAHVPEFPWPDITVRHLLTHTSGLLDQGTLYEGYGARVNASGVVTNAGVVDLLATAKPPLAAPPGTRHAESNVNDIVLVTVLERADGRDIRTLLRETVFAPAGMRDTDVPPVRPPGAPRPEGVAEDYVRVGIAPDGRQAWAPSRKAFGWEFIATLSGTVGDRGIFSTARDLLRFDRALRDGTLLRPETLAAAYAPARDRDGAELWTTDEPPTSHGFGWRLADSRDSVSYAGDWGGFQAGVVRRLADDRVLVYLMNRRTDDRSWLASVHEILDDPARGPAAATAPEPPAMPGPRALAPAEAAEDVALLRRAITELHPGYGRYASTAATDAVLDDLAHDVAAGTTDAELYRRVALACAALRCDHTKPEMPERMARERRERPAYLPFTFRLFAGRMYVDVPGPDAAGLARGDEILALNGRPVGDVLAAIAPHLSVDGWNDHARRVELEHSSELPGDAVDVFWPLLYGWPDAWTLDVRRDRDAPVRTLRLAPVTYDAWLALAEPDGARWQDFRDAVSLELLDERTARLEIGTFVNYRDPVAPEELLDPVFDTLRDEGIEHLVLDLRRCGGGSDDVPGTLFTYLSDTLVPSAKRPPQVRSYRVGTLREHLTTWDDSVFDLPDEMFRDLGDGTWELAQPVAGPRPGPERDNRFRGRLTILTSAANSSGATIFIALAREHIAGVRTVGAPTGGSAEGPTAGLLYTLTLPNSGIRVRIPAMRSFVNVAHPEPGRGVLPDVPVVETADDWRGGRDAVLAAALARPDDTGDADAPFADRVDAAVRAHHEAGAFDGAVLVIRDGAVAYAGAFGLANHAWKVPSAPDTRFPICSITKQFTAFLVVQLAGEGRIDLDAPLLRHLPWYRADTGARITVRHLLQHMSGLPEPVTAFDEIDDALAVAGDTRAAITRFCSGDPTFEPGTAFTYSNADYHVLGAIIEEVTGRPYADVLRTRILEPLGMLDTGVLRHQELVPRLATGIDRTGDELRMPMQFAALGGAAAGMYSTAEDLGAWNLALLEHRLLSRDLTEVMFTPAVVEGVTGNYVALGSWVYRRPLPPDDAVAPRLVERRGHIAPYTGLNVLCPDEGHAFVILSNAMPVDLETLPYASGLPLDLLLLVTGREPEGPAPN